MLFFAIYAVIYDVITMFLSTDEYYVVYTHHDLPMHHITMATERNYFMFNLKACEEAYVILSKDPGVSENDAYQFVMGLESNSKSEIRKQSPDTETKSFTTENILSCDETLPFWITWTSGMFELGKGHTLGSDRLIEWRDTRPYDINGLSLASRHATPAEWDFFQDAGL